MIVISMVHSGMTHIVPGVVIIVNSSCCILLGSMAAVTLAFLAFAHQCCSPVGISWAGNSEVAAGQGLCSKPTAAPAAAAARLEESMRTSNMASCCCYPGGTYILHVCGLCLQPLLSRLL
jgi:hypothetical protein